MVSYWAQEDFPTKSARMHRAECRYCNNGRGWQPQRTRRNNAWYGPFPTPEQAGAACRQAIAPSFGGVKLPNAKATGVVLPIFLEAVCQNSDGYATTALT
jgi:hypothetical protein